jgi:phage anti-repressor protein
MIVSNNLPKGYWNIDQNRKIFLSGLGEKLGFKNLEDWYTITKKNIREEGGKGLLKCYDDSIYKMLKSVYCDHKWNSSQFNRKFLGNWNVEVHRREFLDQLGLQLGFKELEDWYNITKKEITESGGSGLLSKYGNSVFKLIRGVYSEYPWKEFRFNRFPLGFWDTRENRTTWVKQLMEELKIKNLDDWYHVSVLQLRPWQTVFEKYPLKSLLQEAFPNHPWSSAMLQFQEKGSSVQLAINVFKVSNPVASIEKIIPGSFVDSIA